MLAVALLPLLLLGLALERTVSGTLSLSLEPLDPVLERAEAAAHARDPAQERELREARLNLWQAELARRALARRVPLTLLFALASTALLVTGAALLLGRRFTRPVERLAEGMVRVGGGALEGRVPESAVPEARADELELLVRQFNRMAAELEAQRARLRVTESLAAWQEVARGLAHELKNPLTAMKLGLARLSRAGAAQGAAPASPEAARLAEVTGLLAEEIEVLLKMTEGFSQFAKLPPPSRRALDLGALLQDVCSLWREGSPVAIECTAPALLVEGDPDQLRRLIGNLLKNAVEASAARTGPIEARLTAREGRVELLLADRGAGLAGPLEGAEMLRALGSTKPGGSGLGLPISHKIAHDHGGRLRLLPREGGGCEARLELPGPLPAVAPTLPQSLPQKVQT
jgi:nitrogen fixation/metabolism regulation signal transduction histidine kinase